MYYSTNGLIVLQKFGTTTSRYTYFEPPYTFDGVIDMESYIPRDDNALVCMFWIGHDPSERGKIFTNFIQRASADEGKYVISLYPIFSLIYRNSIP